MSQFGSKNLFGSGPHRFAFAERGQEVVPNYVLIGSGIPGTTSVGPRELDVVVRGRLVADTEPALWTLRAAIAAEAEGNAPQTLTDNAGHAWPQMTLISYKEADRVDRGRAWSIAYEATFRKFT